MKASRDHRSKATRHTERANSRASAPRIQSGAHGSVRQVQCTGHMPLQLVPREKAREGEKVRVYVCVCVCACACLSACMRVCT